LRELRTRTGNGFRRPARALVLLLSCGLSPPVPHCPALLPFRQV